jgi:hypothetical protein
MNARRARTTIVLAGLALVAGACGGTPASSNPQPVASSPPSPQPVASSPPAAPSPPDEAVANPAPIVEGQPYRPDLPPPEDFVGVVDNSYMPFMPGARTVFESVSDGQRERNVVVVTDRTKVILGVTTTVVHDQVFSANGDLAEDTFDWYAQDRFGNVWYFGEDTAEYDNGKVSSTKGSWEAGVAGAQPGVVMLAEPTVGESYHQEFLKGEAEDVGTVVAIDDRVTVPYGSFDRVVVTEDTTPLEPQILEHKFYAQGIGVVLERVLRGGREVSRLVSYTPPS